MGKKKFAYSLSIAMCIGMLLVQLMGATVTQTESGRGCGDDWPLCNGKFIPDYTITSIIEYSHRVVSGAVGLVVLIATIAVYKYSRRRDAKVYAGGALFFTVFQAGLGAAQVMNPQSSEILALHFGFSLLAFTCTLLTVVAMRAEMQEDRGIRPQPSQPVSAGFRWFVWLTTIYSYIVVYTGAYTSHTDSGGGCSGFPLCNGAVVPADLSGAVLVAYIHRMAAYLLFALVLIMAIYARRKYSDHPYIYKGSTWALVLVTAQVLSGGLMMVLMGTGSYIFGTLLHSLIITMLFGVLSYLSIAVYLDSKRTLMTGEAVGQ